MRSALDPLAAGFVVYPARGLALEAAAGRPEHVWALALLAIALPMAVHPDLLVSAEAGDHHALDAHLADFGEAANALIGVADAPAEMRGEAARFAARLEGLERFLDRHLVDEEELVVPVLLYHGTGALG